MEAVQKKVENQIQFWTLLGPFFVLLSITALLFKMSPHWYFPLSAVIGIPFCVRWKMKGLTAALGCLFLLAGINSQSLDLTDQYWHVGLSLAMAFSFIILTLSLEESDGLVTKVQVESQSRLDNFLLLDEKWKSAEAEWTQQKKEIQAEVSDLTRESAKLLEEKQIFYKLAQLAKDELIQIRGQHEQLLQDLLYKKEQVAQLHERLDENEQTIQNFVNSDPERKIQMLAKQITTLEKEREVFKAQIALAKEEKESYRVDKERFEEERIAFQTENMRLIEEKEVCNQERVCIEQEKIALKQEREALGNETSSTLAERERVEALKTACNQERVCIEQEKTALKQEREALGNETSSTLAERERVEALKAACNQERVCIEQEKTALKREREALGNETSSTLAERERVEALKAACNQERVYIEQEKTALKRERKVLEVEEIARQEKENGYVFANAQALSKVRLLESDLKALELEKIRSEQLVSRVTDELRCVEKRVEQISCELSKQQALALQANQEKDRLSQENYSLQEALHQKREEKKNAEKEAIFIISSQETAEREWLDAAVRDEGIATAISEERNAADGHSQPGRLPDEIMKVAEKEMAVHGKSILPTHSCSSKARAIELMYKQLKKQFQEKSEVLDVTRRELFAVNEELLKMRRQNEEESVYSYSKEEKRLQGYVIQLGNQFEQMEANFQQEVDDLMQLVGDLLNHEVMQESNLLEPV